MRFKQLVTPIIAFALAYLFTEDVDGFVQGAHVHATLTNIRLDVQQESRGRDGDKGESEHPGLRSFMTVSAPVTGGLSGFGSKSASDTKPVAFEPARLSVESPTPTGRESRRVERIELAMAAEVAFRATEAKRLRYMPFRRTTPRRPQKGVAPTCA